MDCRDEAGDLRALSRPTIGGVERDYLWLDPVAERVTDLSASEIVTQKIVMVMAKDEQTAAVPRAESVDLIGVVSLNEFMPIFLELGVATGRCQRAWRFARVPRVFERFYSLQRPGNGRKSSGLGLCFVREAAALHGGSIALQNRTDRSGARASLRLPLHH